MLTQLAPQEIGEAVSGSLTIGMVAPVWVPMPPRGYGGIEWIVHWLAEGMVGRGHDVTLVASGDTSTRSHLVPSYTKAPFERMGEPVPELIHALTAYDGRLGACDIVHDHTLVGSAIAHHAGVRNMVHTVHGPVDAETSHLYSKVDSVDLVAISHYQRRSDPGLRWAGVIHNAVDVSSFPFSDSHDGYLTCVARMSPTKGIPEAIALARRLGMPLKIAAKRSEAAERDYYDSEVAPLLGDDVEYLGELGSDDKRLLLAGAKALVFCVQWEEPFGIAMVEALACGTPVLGTPRGAIPEVVRDGLTGIVEADPTRLAARAEAELDGIDRHRCHTDALARFDVARMLDDYEALYRRIAAQGSGARPAAAAPMPVAASA